MEWRVFKYSVEAADRFEISMPKGARILTVQTQGRDPFIWALVDPQANLEPRAFRIAKTGQPFVTAADEKLSYIDTFQLTSGSLVFHLFEVLSQA